MQIHFSQNLMIINVWVEDVKSTQYLYLPISIFESNLKQFTFLVAHFLAISQAMVAQSNPCLRQEQKKLNWILCLKVKLNQDLSYDGILAGRPGAWHMKKICNICMQSQNFERDLILKFKTIYRTCFISVIALTVYE